MSNPETIQLKCPYCGGGLQRGWLSTVTHWLPGGFRWERGTNPTILGGEVLARFSRWWGLAALPCGRCATCRTVIVRY